jgi:DNA polymerase-1
MIRIPVHKGDVLLAETLDEVEIYLKSLDDKEVVTFDWETTGLAHTATPLGMAVHQKDLEPMFIPIDWFFTKGLPMKDVAELINLHFNHKKLIAHNAKYDCTINYMNGILDSSTNIVADTLVMVHLYDPSLDKQLEKRVTQDFKYEKQPFTKIVGKKWDSINWAAEGDDLLHTLAGYAGEDAYWTTRLYYKYLPLLDEDAKRIMSNIELPFMWVLRDMKIRGIKINVDLLRDMGVEVDKKLTDIVNLIYEEAGCVFNLNSPKQKQEVFYTKLKMPILKYTKTGAPSTDSDTMEELADLGFTIGEYMTQYSELQKLNSGYIQSIPNLVDDENVLRGDINSCGTETGRCSSSNPNLQNQPNNHDFPVRKSFIPREGYVLFNYDYAQLELRVMAHMSKDKHFTECFLNGEDPHGDVAKRLSIPRKGAKVVNFGVLYGMGPAKLAATLSIPEENAKKIISHDYMKTYYGFAKWKEATENYVQKHGYVKNLFGRTRKLPAATLDPFRGNKKLFYSALRQSVNTIIQGTGADIVKIAMIRIYERFKAENLDAHLLLQVHDEVLGEALLSDAIRAEQIVVECMENSVILDVPMLVDGKLLLDWSEMKDENIVSVPYRYNDLIYSLLM